ncbi:MAG TPA: ankyrin repeat domain-containing protein [Methylomirabilota bacterium]|nr:ankyrin repeat domain-containing protein [Methylomirabilota bacterium]
MNADTNESLKELAAAFHQDDAARVRALLQEQPHLKRWATEPLPNGQGPAITMVRSAAMLDVLADAGADLNAKTSWWAGGFGLLHLAPLDVARHALTRGATMDIHAAARLGDVASVNRLLDADPSLVHARGGDGQTPLHFAANLEVAEALVRRGADLNVRDIDHESTPVRWMLDTRQEIARFLVERGCETDIFMGAALGIPALVEKALKANPEDIRMRVSPEYFPMSDRRAGGTIYQWTLGWHVSPHQVARKFSHEAVFQLLMDRSPDDVKLVNACWLGDEQLAADLLQKFPALPKQISAIDLKQVTHAARNNNIKAVTLMLRSGWPVNARGQHGGTPLHWAAWHGNVAMLREILAFGPDLNMRDHDYNATPVGWAIHASENGWGSPGADYVESLRTLLGAGAEPPSAISGTPEVQAFLRGLKR